MEKKQPNKIITSSAKKNVPKNLANKALLNRTNNKTIKKVVNANITKAAINKGTRNLRRIRNWDIN